MATEPLQSGAYSTGQAARICRVAPRTVGKWVDSGILKGYRIPVSKGRRILRADLLKFLVAQAMPLDLMGELSAEELREQGAVREPDALRPEPREEADGGRTAPDESRAAG
jgi:hypothetical protein